MNMCVSLFFLFFFFLLQALLFTAPLLGSPLLCVGVFVSGCLIVAIEMATSGVCRRVFICIYMQTCGHTLCCVS